MRRIVSTAVLFATTFGVAFVGLHAGAGLSAAAQQAPMSQLAQFLATSANGLANLFSLGDPYVLVGLFISVFASRIEQARRNAEALASTLLAQCLPSRGGLPQKSLGAGQS